MSDTKNYLLLDIDGAVAPSDGVIGEKVVDGIVVNAPYANWYVPERAATLLYFMSMKKDKQSKNDLKVETLWSSNWTDDSNYINKELEIDPFGFVQVNPDEYDLEPGEWLKSPGLKDFVVNHITEDNTIVIVDDEFSKDFVEWSKQYPNLHLITTESEEGITNSQSEEIIGLFF